MAWRRLGIARESHLVVANDKIEMDRVGDHVAYLVKPDGKYLKFTSRSSIAQGIVEFAEEEF